MDDVCPAPVKERYWEIDAIRGFSLLAMILFHTVFLLGVFHIINVDVWLRLGIYLPLGTSVFVIISGTSLILRHGRMLDKPRRTYYLAILKRGIEIMLIGLGVSIVASLLVLVFINDGRYVYFNFLQMMGLSMILCIPFLRFGKWSLIPAVLFFLLGLFLETIKGPAWLMVFGILPPDYYPRDFFPVFPWVGVMLFGVFLGALLYPNGIRRYHLRSAGKISQVLALIGKYPLQIYLIHIPLIGTILFIIVVLSGLCGFPIGYI
ncbi:MAG: heparan-alpha-glucosaminide N-acetyltransferase [Methanocorpusculum sp.]|uniref:heparan-alpha-glucosaminide N-acetyltransferase n=1 Tax=Methanocorpusculum sp. TaxID=2058474 RepID=UPI0027209183|nr:heparan-alpha-glucosaminide N-acetyltransferase [Methanocorpusculum sp.]MDO9522655.1 heparan-alpha-glucosaminide N-acetyltransferase [Methanocorpusculum sp.]